MEEKPENMPFNNPNLSIKDRISDLLNRLTLKEKINFLCHLSPAIPRLKIEEYNHGNEALHGVVRPGRFTVFPQAIAFGATWNPKLVYELATAISDEARAKHNHEDNIFPHGLLTFWSPTVNMARDPRWGRTPETYGEDPFLTSQIGIQFVKGMQGNDSKYLKVVSTPKHFVANNEEHNRFYCQTNMSEKILREYYLPAFKALITEGKAFSIMGAYNAVGGVPCCQNKRLITDILRKEWDFKGYAVTDCGAVGNATPVYHNYVKTAPEAAAATIKAGIDLECGDVYRSGALLEAVKNNLVSQKTIDLAVINVLRGRFKLGLFDPKEQCPYSKIPFSIVGGKKHSDLALKVSLESIVLLKNTPISGKKVLPLNLDEIKSIAVIGPNARICQFGDYTGSPVNEPISPLMGLKRKLREEIEINSVPWRVSKKLYIIPRINLKPIENCDKNHGLKHEFFPYENFQGESILQYDDVLKFEWNEQTIEYLLSKVVKDSGIDLDNHIFSMRWSGYILPDISGEYTIYIKKRKCSAIIYINDEKYEKNSIQLNFEAGKQYKIRIDVPKIGLMKKKSKFSLVRPKISLYWRLHPSSELDEGFSREIEAAKTSDLIIAFLGISTFYEQEGLDRKDLQLPSEQKSLIQAVFEVNPNVIVVLINGSPLAINWINEHIPAVIEAWYPGERGGDAIADVLMGDYNPGGRLPLTFYKGLHQLLPFNEYNIDKGQTYMYLEDEPLYPFGYGLSYTEFKYQDLNVDLTNINISSTEIIHFSLFVENIGKIDGDEVVQLYIKDVDAQGPENKKPYKALKSFKRVHVKAGKREKVILPVRVKDLASYNVEEKKWIVEPRKLDVLIGASSKDIRLKTQIELE